MSDYNFRLAAVHINHVAKSCLNRTGADTPNAIGLRDIIHTSQRLYDALTGKSPSLSEQMGEER